MASVPTPLLGQMLSRTSVLVVAALGIALAATPLAAQDGGPSNRPLVPGDRVLVRIWADSVLADSARVDASGAVVAPVVGRIPVSGLPADAAVDSLRRTYARVFRSSGVDLVPLRRTVVSGEVRRPGVYFLETSVTIREAVAIAGGLTELAAADRVSVSRGEARIAMRNWDARTDAQATIHSGDVIWVARAGWFQRNALSLVSAAGVLLSVTVALLAR